MRVYGENIGQELAWLCGVITSLVDRIELLEHKLAEYDPNDYIRKDEFDPDEVWTHDQFDPDDYIHEDGLEESVERIVRSTLSDATVSINLDY
jgi:hypothetical protein